MPICINCITGNELPGEPKGTIEKIGPYSTYVAKSGDAAQAGKAIVSLTDVFGLALKNSKIIADMVAEKTGVTVYVPDVCSLSLNGGIQTTNPRSSFSAL